MESIFKPSRRIAERNAFCRACSCNIDRGTEMISWYSIHGKGTNIHLCLPCISKLNELLDKEIESE